MFLLVPIGPDGKALDQKVAIQALPFVIGRESSADLQLEQPGIWESHARLDLDKQGRLAIQSHSECSYWLNDQARNEPAALKPGDVVKLGSTSLRLDLAPADLKPPVYREALIIGLAALFVASQFYLIYRYLSE